MLVHTLRQFIRSLVSKDHHSCRHLITTCPWAQMITEQKCSEEPFAQKYDLKAATNAIERRNTG